MREVGLRFYGCIPLSLKGTPQSDKCSVHASQALPQSQQKVGLKRMAFISQHENVVQLCTGIAMWQRVGGIPNSANDVHDV